MKVGSLFSGAGCGDLGLEWAGLDHAWFCEVDPYARKILALRWPGKPIYEDIREVDFTQVEPVDMLAGGFPCQDISVAGKGAGLEGARSGLWTEYARAIAEIRPRYALIENSPALVTRGLDVVLSDLASLGYDAEWHCVPASALGAPHKRDRIWIVANARGGRCGEPEGRQVEQPRGTEAISASPHVADAEGQPERARLRPDEQAEVGRGRSGDSGGADDIPDAAGHGRKSRRAESEGQQRAARIVGHCGEVPNTVRPGREELDIAALAARAGQRSGGAPAGWGTAWWATEPGLGRVAHGVANRVDRLKCIGNGQVPHCTYLFGRLILDHARSTSSKISDKE